MPISNVFVDLSSLTGWTFTVMAVEDGKVY